MLSVERLTIDGSVGGDVTYSSDTQGTIANDAVAGSVERIEPTDSAERSDVDVPWWGLLVGWFLWLLFALVALSLVTLAAGLLAPRLLQRVTDQLVPSPWKALLVGTVAAIAVPAALLFLVVTVVGAPLALACAAVWSVLTAATFVFGAYMLGRLVFRGRRHPVVMSLVGGAILITALHIPWVNVPVWIAMVLFGLGAQLLELYRRRPWVRAVDPTSTSTTSTPSTSAREAAQPQLGS